MATVIAESLKARFAELQAWRDENWSPAQLEKNAGQRRKLVERFDAAAIAQPGEILPPYVFSASDQQKVWLDDLVAQGPAVLVFFRFAGCPACNIALRHYEESLQPALRERGIPLLALSPQISERLGEDQGSAVAQLHRRVGRGQHRRARSRHCLRAGRPALAAARRLDRGSARQ